MKLLYRYLIFIMFFIVFSLNSSTALACDLLLSPINFTAEAGEVLTFTLERYQTHRSCSVPLENTEISVTGGKVVDYGTWETGDPDILTFQVQFEQPGEGTVLAERYCSKDPSIQATAIGTISDSVYAEDQSQAAASAIPDLPQSGSEILSDETPAHVLDNTDTEADEKLTIDTNSENKVIADPDNDSLIEPEQNKISDSKSAANTAQDKMFVWGGETSSFLLWLFFIAGGLILYYFKLAKLRKPWLFASVLILGFYLGLCPCPISMVFNILLGTISLLLIIIVITSLVYGRVFCGWACPIGAVQDIIGIEGIKFKIPGNLDHYLKYLKYAVLIGFAYLTIQWGQNAFCLYDPFKVLFNFTGTGINMILLTLVLLGSLFIKRFFCRYLCPLGAVLAIGARFAPLALKIKADTCIGCKKCTKNVCPVGALSLKNPEDKTPVIDNSECINCLQCVDVCVKNAVD